MCAIFSGSNVSTMEILYEANLPRGNFATGVICLYDANNQQTIKKEGSINFNEIQLDESCDYFIGHCQAPTSAKRSWAYETSHPFESLSWSVCHNGIITNWKELREKYDLPSSNPVDSAVITDLLQYFTENEEEARGHEIIKRVLGELRGSFAVCIIDTDCNEVYIARQGSVLHFNEKGSFSTLGGQGYKVLPEGVVMRLENYSKWEVMDTFQLSSPFVFV